MDCPIDGETLVMSERRGVEIDYCPRCRGVWLDRGELDKLVSVAERDDDDRWGDRDRGGDRHEIDDRSDRDDRYDRDRYDRDRYDSDRGSYPGGKRRKKSFLSEMFEFGD